MQAIDTRHLRKTYGPKVAVEDLTLSVGQGEVFGFLGPNGAGKSTFVKMLVGLVRPTAGEAWVLGQPLGDIETKRRLGFVPELFRFQEWLRADEFLDFHGRLCRLDKSVRRQRAGEVLELVGLASRAGDRLSTFSKGMLQRIGIAQALMGDPDIVVLDEPTSALDPVGRRDVRDLIHHLRTQGKTVFLNSHLLSEVEMVCDRVAIIDRGRVVRQGGLRELLGERELELAIGGLTDRLLETLAARWRVVRRAGGALTLAVADETEAAQVASAVLAGGGQLFAMTPSRRSLEDLFVELVSREADEVQLPTKAEARASANSPAEDASPDEATTTQRQAAPTTTLRAVGSHHALPTLGREPGPSAAKEDAG